MVTLPLAALALVMALRFVPAHVNETSDPVDNLGGILSVLMVAAVVLAINFAPVPNRGALALGLAAIAVAAGVGFVIRQRRARAPLYDLDVAGRRIFWVAACAGIIVFGTLMGAMFVGQQFLQNVLGYSTLDAGLAILPAAVFMVLIAPRSAKLVEARGSRVTLLVGYAFCLLGFLTMLLLWKEDISYWKVGLGYALIGIGVGFAGTPASHSLTGSVPVDRAGMASGTADLQRDLGGAIMQSILGALLTAGYAAAAGAAIAAAPNGDQINDSVQNELTKSFSSAADTAQQYPQYADNIIAGAKSSFLQGDRVGLHRRDRRDPARRRDRLLPLPEARRGGGAADRVPSRGRGPRPVSLAEHDDDEEHQDDLADDPRVVVHPVADLGQQRLGSLAQRQDQQGGQAEQEEREGDERQRVPPRVTVIGEVGADDDRGEEVAGKEAQQEEAQREAELGSRRLQLAHPLRRFRLLPSEEDEDDRDDQQANDHVVDRLGLRAPAAPAALEPLGDEVGGRDDARSEAAAPRT